MLYLNKKLLILRNIHFNQRIQSSRSTVRLCDREGNYNYVNRIERAGNPIHMAKFVLAVLIPLVLLSESWSYKFRRGYSHHEDQYCVLA